MAEWKRTKVTSDKFRFGQKVSFLHGGQKYIGSVKKIMKKNIKVKIKQVDDKIIERSSIWHCSPNSLKIEESKKLKPKKGLKLNGVPKRSI